MDYSEQAYVIKEEKEERKYNGHCKLRKENIKNHFLDTGDYL